MVVSLETRWCLLPAYVHHRLVRCLQKDDALKLLNLEVRKYLVCRKKTLIAHQLPEKIDQVMCHMVADA